MFDQKEYLKQWRVEHREHMKEYDRKYYEKNKLYMNKQSRIYHQKNKERLNKLHREYLRQFTINLKLEVLIHYGGSPPRCACCGETTFEFLTIDHINNDGAKHRKLINRKGFGFYLWLRKNGFPEGFQVLCMNCNWGRAHNKGICPHKINKIVNPLMVIEKLEEVNIYA